MIRRLSLLTLCVVSALGLMAYEGPVMGWSSWNTYRVNISDSLIKKQDDAMANTGLAKAGYRYVNIDDGFFGGRDADGRLLAHPKRFPSGLKPVADHIHSLGLKAGIYSDGGRNTCGNYFDKDTIATGVGLYGHDEQDAQFYFNDMGFDFIKVDFCGGNAKQNYERLTLDERTRYEAIAEAIRKTGRDDVKLNICRWDFPGVWAADIAASWRISHDIAPRWKWIKDIINQNLYLSAYCRNGKFNDMDMLEVGRGMTPDEDRTHFGIWSIMSSPLMIGCDMTTLSPETFRLLTSPDLIAINQDPLALQAYPVAYDSGAIVLVKDLKQRHGLKRAFAVYNPTDSVVDITVDMAALDLAGRVHLKDAYGVKADTAVTGEVTLSIPPHGTEIYIADAERSLDRTYYGAETAYIGNYQEIKNPVEARTGYYRDRAEGNGAYAANLGGSEDNYLEWSNVHVSTPGKYRMAVRSLTDEPRTARVYVDGKERGQLKFTGKGDASLMLKLSAGEHSIRLCNTEAQMPDIDFMRLQPENL